MITIQSTLLVLLGFLIASLIVLFIAPAYWHRAVTLTTRRLKQSLPMTEAEINADKDRIRAEYAIKVHKLETRAEATALTSARQQIELNRRDAAISALEVELARMRTLLEEHENARRVMEQTITDRFPRVERRLADARTLLLQRDQEIQALSDMSTRQARALEEATQINTQQRDEMMRLSSSLAARAARNRESLADPRFDAEVALRSEIEALRAANRDQAALIERLQAPSEGERGKAALEARAAVAGLGALTGAGLGPGADATLDRLRRDLQEAEAALRAARGEAAAGQAGRTELETEIRALRARTEDQAAEIARLAAALKTFEDGEPTERSISLKDSRIAMKARLNALQAETDQQAQTIQRLRAEIATGNERMARQAAHFMDEMRRLGAGTLTPAGADGRRGGAAQAATRPRPLSERIREPRSASPTPSQQPEPAVLAPASRPAPVSDQDPARVSGFLRALGGGAAARGSDGRTSAMREEAPATAASDRLFESELASSQAPYPDAQEPEPSGPATQRRGRLLDRLSEAGKKAETGAA